MMRPDHHDLKALDNMKPWKMYCFYNFTMSSCYGKDVTEMQSLVCADNELQTKKILKFRLGGRAHSLTLLEFARRLGLYQAVELDEEGFNVYFEGEWVCECSLVDCKMDEEEGRWHSKGKSGYATLRDLINSEGKLIPEDPQPGVPRVGIPRTPRASM
ncbi:hypothetical protein Tco_1352889 [Tanacetum coccineum]